MTDLSIVRDRFGRPYVTTDGKPLEYVKGRKSPANAEGYTRVSTLAGTLDDKSNLLTWAAANALVGMVRNKEIAYQVGSLASKHADPWNVPEGKTALKSLVDRAQKAGGSEEASGMGTAFHELCEVVDEGGWPEYAPTELVPWLHDYRETLSGYGWLDSEPFLVNDELKTAGSMDRLFRTPDGRIVAADIKSGKHDPTYPLKVTLQVAVYANSVRYDQVTGERSPIHPDIDLERGLLIHAPIRGGGRPKTTVYELDLVKGMEFARLALAVREARAWERKAKLVPFIGKVSV